MSSIATAFQIKKRHVVKTGKIDKIDGSNTASAYTKQDQDFGARFFVRVYT